MIRKLLLQNTKSSLFLMQTHQTVRVPPAGVFRAFSNFQFFRKNPRRKIRWSFSRQRTPRCPTTVNFTSFFKKLVCSTPHNAPRYFLIPIPEDTLTRKLDLISNSTPPLNFQKVKVDKKKLLKNVPSRKIDSAVKLDLERCLKFFNQTSLD